MINISPEKTILLAKLRHVEELERLSVSTELIETIGLMSHQLQAERGVSCLYIASSGKRLAQERNDLIAQNIALVEKFSTILQQHLDESTSADAKQLTLISWILLGLQQLTSFRDQVSSMKITFVDCMHSYTRLINSLISLIFEITDSTVNSKVSTYLVALYNLVQGKEFAGQERAVGAYMLGSGTLQLANQQRLLDLIEMQDRHFEAFNQFAVDELKQAWNKLEQGAISKQHQSYRAKFIKGTENQILKTSEADAWFDICSKRLAEIWSLQCQLIYFMRETLKALIKNATDDLDKTQLYLNQLQRKPSPSATLDSTFFNLSIPIENAFSFNGDEKLQSYPMESIIHLLQVQSQQIAKIETELTGAKKALAERKQIEHAKGLVMNNMGVSEVEAYKIMRKTAMEQNRKIIEVAENILVLAKVKDKVKD